MHSLLLASLLALSSDTIKSPQVLISPTARTVRHCTAPEHFQLGVGGALCIREHHLDEQFGGRLRFVERERNARVGLGQQPVARALRGLMRGGEIEKRVAFRDGRERNRVRVRVK